ncbi:MAG: prephenate dehydratase [Acidobacteriota bacterium]|nr:prephenate dehydratase [Acidobacteriota bacterium]
MMRIAYQGEPGAYSEAAALRFETTAELLSCESFEKVFSVVSNQTATHGVLPIENTIGGTIHRNYDLLLQYELPIIGEVKLPIVHNLLALAGTSRDQLRKVYSHPQGLAQCEQFLRTLHNVEIVATYDTAGSAKMIRDGQLSNTGAIASARAAEVFGLSILDASVQDFAANTTRFLVIGRDQEPAGTANKTTIVFTVPNDAGALFKALSVFALRDIDMTKLESRPIPERPFEYLFYADLSAAREELSCKRALTHLAEFAPSLRTLGSYRRWEDTEEAS